MASSKILVVDDEQSILELTKSYLNESGYFCDTVQSFDEGLKRLTSDQFDLVMTDVKMSQQEGIDLLYKIKNIDSTLAVIVLTSSEDTKQAVECLKVGASDYILKPFQKDAIQIAVQRALERRELLLEKKAYRAELEKKVRGRTMEVVRAYHEIENTYQQTLEALISALDFREQSTAGHSKRAVDYTRLLALQMGIRGKQLVDITRGALLHDVGKIGISDTILLKPGKLTDDEWDIMRRHPIYGHQMLKDINFLDRCLDIVLYHHERFDGNGYPQGLKGEDIPIGARIFSVVDAFDSITSNRVYRSAQSFRKAYKILRENEGTQFDPQVLDSFVRIPESKIKRIFQLSMFEQGKSKSKNITNNVN